MKHIVIKLKSSKLKKKQSKCKKHKLMFNKKESHLRNINKNNKKNLKEKNQ
jgi:hypothetical protein